MIMYPRPNSILFWDMIVLNGYLLLNIFIGWNVLAAERKGAHYQDWVKVLIYISIPWAFSIHTVTAFLYAGLPGRHFWLTAIMAARFLASAFCSGPALLILLCLVVRKVTRFDPGKEQLRTLAGIVAYAMVLNVFFMLLEVFTAFYSQIPGHMNTFVYLYRGLEGHGRLVPYMWASVAFAIIALILLIVPGTRREGRHSGGGLRGRVPFNLVGQRLGAGGRWVHPRSLRYGHRVLAHLTRIIHYHWRVGYGFFCSHRALQDCHLREGGSGGLGILSVLIHSLGSQSR